MKMLGMLAVLIAGFFLLRGVSGLPVWGDPRSPANASPISHHYLTQTGKETDVPNVVTAILGDYRGYDTLFETVVIFTAGIAIIAILRPLSKTPHAVTEPKRDLIVETTCRVLMPVIQLFALYVLAHGHPSPGGGFQSGVILGASFILFALSYDLETALRRFSHRRLVIYAACGIGIYAGIGLLCLFLGRNFLDYGVLTRVLPVESEAAARYYGIFGVEAGVAMTVSAVMFAIYVNLASRGALTKGL